MLMQDVVTMDEKYDLGMMLYSLSHCLHHFFKKIKLEEGRGKLPKNFSLMSL